MEDRYYLIINVLSIKDNIYEQRYFLSGLVRILLRLTDDGEGDKTAATDADFREVPLSYVGMFVDITERKDT